MDYQIREMGPHERKAVRALGRRAFMGFESLFIPRPVTALVAVCGERIVGAVLYKSWRTGKKKIGYIDFVFVDASSRGSGIGRCLLDRATSLLWENGCDYCSALVRDDNVGSWGLFLRRGYRRLSLYQIIRELGLAAALKQYFGTVFSAAVGFEFYLARRNGTLPVSKGNTPAQITGYLVMNSAVIALMAMVRQVPLDYALLGAMGIWTGIILSGFLGTLFSKEDWQYRMTEGGFSVHMVVSLAGGIFPFAGNWYPRIYRKVPDFSRALGTTALFQWGFLIVLSALPATGLRLPPPVAIACQIARPLAVVFAVPFYPAVSFSGGRVFHWNVFVYALMLVLTASAILL